MNKKRRTGGSLGNGGRRQEEDGDLGPRKVQDDGHSPARKHVHRHHLRPSVVSSTALHYCPGAADLPFYLDLDFYYNQYQVTAGPTPGMPVMDKGLCTFEFV